MINFGKLDRRRFAKILFITITILVFSIPLQALDKEIHLQNARINLEKIKSLYDDTVKEYQKVLELDPENEAAHFGQAQLYEYKGLVDEATAEYEKVTKINPANLAANYRLGESYLSKEWLVDRAVKVFEQVVNQIEKGAVLEGINSEDIYYNLAEAYYEAGYSDKAVEYYKKTIELNDKHYKAHYSLGVNYYEEGENESAIKELEKTVLLYPGYEDSLYYLGLAYYYNNQKGKAIEALNEAVKNDPNNAFIREWLGYIYLNTGQLDLAAETYKETVRLNPQNAGKHYYSLGNIYLRKKEYSEAVEYYKKAVELNPQITNYLYSLADCYRFNKDFKNEKLILRRVFHYAELKLAVLVFTMLLPALITFIFGKRLLRVLKDDTEQRITQFHKFREWAGRALGVGIGLLILLTSCLKVEYLSRLYSVPSFFFTLLPFIVMFFLVNIIYAGFDKIVRQTSLGLMGYFKLSVLRLFSSTLIFLIYYGIFYARQFLPESYSKFIYSLKFAVLILTILWILVYVFSAFLVKLFNKTHPLETGDLRNRLEELRKRAQVNYKDILIVDTSRIKLASAIATGLWPRFRYIFLSNYLLEILTPAEIETVVAHEIGHYKKGHIKKQFIGVLFFLLIIAAIILFSAGYIDKYKLTGIVVNFLPLIVLLLWSIFIKCGIGRRHEKQADEYVVDICDNSQDYVTAFKKLYLSNYIPAKWKSKTHFSLDKRISHIEQRMKEKEKNGGILKDN